jgi:hypothetical protein
MALINIRGNENIIRGVSASKRSIENGNGSGENVAKKMTYQQMA